MSHVHDLRSTLLYALVGAFFLGLGLWRRSRGEPVEHWVASLAVGVLVLALLADGIQRRLRGDPRTRDPEFDGRTVLASAVALVAIALVGAWSFAAGHRPLTWVPLSAGGLVGLGVLAWRRLRGE